MGRRQEIVLELDRAPYVRQGAELARMGWGRELPEEGGGGKAQNAKRAEAKARDGERAHNFACSVSSVLACGDERTDSDMCASSLASV